MHSSDLITLLKDKIVEINPRQKSFLNESIKSLSSGEKEMLESYIENKLDEGQGIEVLAESYNKIVNDTLSEQIFFRKFKRYRHSLFDQVANSVYHDDKYMNFYMLGLALTQFLWKNHRQLFEFFTEVLPTEKPGAYLEVGPGHGLHFCYAISHCRFEKYVAIDLSDTSIRLTKEAVKKIESKKEIVIEKKDFFNMKSSEKFDFLVMGEVLEHVEDPLLFLKKLNELKKPGGKVFISTCCNAPAVDHIYLFSTVEDVRILCQQAGLKILSERLTPHPGTSIEESEKRLLPINLAMVLE